MKRTYRNIARTLALVISLFIGAQAAQAKDTIYTGTFSSNAVSGYDTVAYFTQGKQ